MNVLIVDDERNVLMTTAVAIDSAGHKAFKAQSIRQAERVLTEEHIHVILLDRMLQNEDGLDFLQQLTEKGNTRPVIVFTAHASIESAVEAMRRGAYTYIEKPFIPEQIRHTLKQLEKRLDADRQVGELQEQIAHQSHSILMDSQEPAMRRAYKVAFKAAGSEASILLLGPSGTGKSVIARQIHDNSDRRGCPFVSISCPSLSRELLESELFGHVRGAFTGAVKDSWGKVQAADGGTLFLDEIGDLPPSIQPKLLRLLQERQYERVGETRTRQADIRVIAATNMDLEKQVAEGNFREDLYYRLNVISIEMPPLAERPNDIEILAQNFLSFFTREQNRPKLSFTPRAIEKLRSYSWPGNLRELRNVIERAVILSDGPEMDAGDLSVNSRQETTPVTHPGAPVSLHKMEEEHIRNILDSAASLEEAARILEIDTATLYRKRKRMGLI